MDFTKPAAIKYSVVPKMLKSGPFSFIQSFIFLLDPSEIDVEGVTENTENAEKIKRKRKIKSEGNDGKKKRRRSPVKSSPYKNGCVMCPDLKVNSYKVRGGIIYVHWCMNSK